MSQNRTGSNILDLLLQSLQTANALTPTVASIIGIVKRGREAGKTDDEIKAESMAVAEETNSIANQQLNVKPTQ